MHFIIHVDNWCRILWGEGKTARAKWSLVLVALKCQFTDGQHKTPVLASFPCSSFAAPVGSQDSSPAPPIPPTPAQGTLCSPQLQWKVNLWSLHAALLASSVRRCWVSCSFLPVLHGPLGHAGAVLKVRSLVAQGVQEHHQLPGRWVPPARPALHTQRVLLFATLLPRLSIHL